MPAWTLFCHTNSMTLAPQAAWVHTVAKVLQTCQSSLITLPRVKADTGKYFFSRYIFPSSSIYKIIFSGMFWLLWASSSLPFTLLGLQILGHQGSPDALRLNAGLSDWKSCFQVLYSLIVFPYILDSRETSFWNIFFPIFIHNLKRVLYLDGYTKFYQIAGNRSQETMF